jgi:hypothetical protein
MPAKPSQSDSSGRGFDAVAESRRWKEAVAAETAGLSVAERMTWFRRQSSVPAIRERAEAEAEGTILREEPPKSGEGKPR